MTTKENKDDLNMLKAFKEKYEFTCPEVADALGVSLRGGENWQQGKEFLNLIDYCFLYCDVGICFLRLSILFCTTISLLCL